MNVPCGCTPDGAWELPPPVSDEILQRYGDVVRVGSINVNGERLCWDTDACSARQLQNFSGALCSKLRSMPELDSLTDEELNQTAYWFCKAVSMNYALVDVLLLLEREFGELCTVKTRKEGTSGAAGLLVEYDMQIRAPQHGLPPWVVLALVWKKSGNVVTMRLPADGSIAWADRVRGTLSRVETEFALPPTLDFCPKYQVHGFHCAPARTSICGRWCGRTFGRTLPIEEPLSSEALLTTCCSKSRRSSSSKPVYDSAPPPPAVLGDLEALVARMLSPCMAQAPALTVSVAGLG